MKATGAGSVALVTGASRGIGAAIARRLAHDGFAVALVARGAEALERTAAGLRELGLTGHAYPCDVGRRDQVGPMIEAVRHDLGTVSVLVNNAGWGGPFHRADEVSDDEWKAVFEVNLQGPRLLCEALLGPMAVHGSGRVINISSIMGLVGGAGSSTYSASKHALIGYTRSLALEWAGSDITCNAVCPGYIATAMTGEAGHIDEARRTEILRGIPAGRFGRPEEVASLVAYLASPDAAYCSGGVYMIDGGLTAGR